MRFLGGKWQKKIDGDNNGNRMIGLAFDPAVPAFERLREGPALIQSAKAKKQEQV